VRKYNHSNITKTRNVYTVVILQVVEPLTSTHIGFSLHMELTDGGRS